LLRATPRVGTASRPLPWGRNGCCSEWPCAHAEFLHLHHCILPIIASSTPKIPSANLFFQPHPLNTEKTSSLISALESHAKETPIPSAWPLLMRALALRNVCRGVGGAIYQATVPQELFPMALAMARGNALRVSALTSTALIMHLTLYFVFRWFVS
jgi:hypothetical protein